MLLDISIALLGGQDGLARYCNSRCQGCGMAANIPFARICWSGWQISLVAAACRRSGKMDVNSLMTALISPPAGDSPRRCALREEQSAKRVVGGGAAQNGCTMHHDVVRCCKCEGFDTNTSSRNEVEEGVR